MDHEHIDEERPSAFRRRGEAKGRPGEAPTDPPLPSVIGNAAFARLVQGAGAIGVQRHGAPSQGAGPLDPTIGKAIDDARSGGEPLSDPVRVDMQSSLGANLDHVRVHNDTRADVLARSVQAEAFTAGTDVFFRSGAYTPGSSDGRRLLAHELTHVVQQGTGQVEGGRVSHPDDAHEVEARAVGDAVASAPPAEVPVARVSVGAEDGTGTPAVSREEVEEEPAPPEPVEAGVARQEIEEDIEEEEPQPAGQTSIQRENLDPDEEPEEGM